MNTLISSKADIRCFFVNVSFTYLPINNVTGFTPFKTGVFEDDGAELLKTLVSHIRSADYANNIAGYQLCGGTIQEWMHHDLFSSFSDMGLKKLFTNTMRQGCHRNVQKMNIPYMQTGADKPFYDTDELRDFFVSSGVNCYNSDGCVVYVGGGIPRDSQHYRWRNQYKFAGKIHS